MNRIIDFKFQILTRNNLGFGWGREHVHGHYVIFSIYTRVNSIEIVSTQTNTTSVPTKFVSLNLSFQSFDVFNVTIHLCGFS